MGRPQSETLLAYAAGFSFAIGWWLWIDANVYSHHTNDPVQVSGVHYIPGIISTIGLIMVNLVSWSDLNGVNFLSDNVSAKARIWLLFAFVVSFAGLVVGVWMAVVHWFQGNPNSQYPGVALIVQNLLIFAGGAMYRFAKPSDEDAF